MHHLPERTKTLKSIKKCISQNGWIVMFEPNNDAFFRKILLSIRGILKIYTDDEVFIGTKALEKELKLSGFESIQFEYQNLQYQIQPHHNLTFRLFLYVYRIYSWIIPPNRFTASFFTCYAKLREK
jgi:hypothetical protein